MKKQNNLLEDFAFFVVVTLLVVLSLNSVSAEECSAELPNPVTQGNLIQLTTTSSNSTSVNITKVVFPNQSFALLGEYPMTKNGSNYNFTFSNTNTLGRYYYTTVGDPSGVIVPQSVCFEVTPNGQDFSTGKAISYIGFIIILLFIFILTMIGAIQLRWKHLRSDEDKVISVNNFRYIKVFLFCMAYLEIMFLFGLSYKFFSEANIQGFTEFFNFVYQLFLNLMYPTIVLTIVIFFIIWINNLKLEKRLKLGL